MALIRKIGLCVVRDGRLLVFRKKGGRTWILPGGKPEKGETDVQALEREVMDECGRRIADAELLLTCRSPAADRPGDEVELVAYVGAINGEPVIAAEIVEAAWLDIEEPGLPIAPSIADHVLPALRERAKRPVRLYHGTSSTRYEAALREGVLKRASIGDLCLSLTDDLHVARYFARNACTAEDGDGPVVLAVDVVGLDARPHSSTVWGDGGQCDWERETACWQDVPMTRVVLVEPMEPARLVRYDADAQRIQRGDAVVAMALRLANGRWCLSGVDDRRIGRMAYTTPKEVLKAYDALHAEGRL